MKNATAIKGKSGATEETGGESPSRLIDARIAELGDWRGETLARIRDLIRQADPEVVEEWKWRGVPVWSHGGIICTGETYKAVVKMTFAKGASLDDPSGLFNSSLEGNTRRAIDIREGEAIDEAALKDLIRAAVALNLKGKKGKSPSSEAKPVLLSGGNPQIAKGYGDAPVQAYIAAMPGWKSDIGRRLDAIIVRTVPEVRKAVKWNSPFYGLEGQGWFLSFHCFTKYIKVTFFRGTSLRPVPPGESKHNEVRYLDIREGEFDEAQFAAWVKQASQLPGEKL
ncbi:DUF1801 domain-containing protein [Inquilinus limosus]|uniref:DUF1801 domain-containing protein n=1 Tax=Inquilinus limosus TaxID=171674 RepID=UPI003F5CE7F5